VKEIAELVRGLADTDPAVRDASASKLYMLGVEPADAILNAWCRDPELAALLLRRGRGATGESERGGFLGTTVGVAVMPEIFEKIHAANCSPRLAEVPPDQDAREFELHFGPGISLDILTTRAPGGGGSIARFLEKHGEGIQQVEYLTTDVGRAAELLRARFGLTSVYPATRSGADGTRVNFFLVSTAQGGKILIELVEAAGTRM
jgi:methylmalonyl-CoA/ethylmalonyl-CoA epimerase